MKYILFFFCLSCILKLDSQTIWVKGRVSDGEAGLPFAHILISEENGLGVLSDTSGLFSLEVAQEEDLLLDISLIGYEKRKFLLSSPYIPDSIYQFVLVEATNSLTEVVVSGSKRPVNRLESPVPVEVYTLEYFRANPAPSIFESMQNVNGVRPQINCNVCNTGDIHINGLEGPYTMVLIDGMPIVSGLSTVYGLNGIPQALIERVEVVKGPASTLYGSEAVGGLINVITKNPLNVSPFSLDLMGTSWGEWNADIGIRHKIGRHHSLVGLNYFSYDNPVDKNSDGFTDVTVAQRISLFNKWSFRRQKDRVFNLAARYLYEDRWGGQMGWNKQFRGGSEIYGESIYTNRWEIFGTYEVPVGKEFQFDFSANGHQQNSVYGATFFKASQEIYFGQLTWHREFSENSNLLLGAAHRYTFYDDNTPATAGESSIINRPSKVHLPGLFSQFEKTFSHRFKILTGLRYDFNNRHGHILSPRLNLKWNNSGQDLIIRLSGGNGYRVANIFTEDHAALTGARKVVFHDDLNPEKSWNVNLNLIKKFYTEREQFFGIDFSAFYTHFFNRIIPDYESNPNLIIYDNLKGYAISQGLSLNFDFGLPNQIQGRLGATIMDVSITENAMTYRQLLTEKFSSVWNISYTIPKINLKLDYSGNLYSPMRLPLLGPLDERPEYSPWFSIQNVQLTRKFKTVEFYGGVKNIFDFKPPANSIARAFDPFDREVLFDTEGLVISTPENPQALTFDPTYVFAPNQGIRFFLGIRYEMY